MEPIKEEPDAQQAQEAQELTKEDFTKKHKERAFTISFLMDMLRDPEETLLFATTSENPVVQQFALRAYEKRMDALFAKVAERTNADPAQVRDPKTRTKEQQALMYEISAAEQMQRTDLFFNSNFYQAFSAVTPLNGKYNHPGEMVNELIKQNAVFYYFVKNPDIKPIGPAQLTAKQIDEIKSLFFKLNDYCYKVTNGGKLELPESYFADFIEAEGVKLPAVHYINGDKYETVTDKLANMFFAFNAPISGEINGQQTMIPLRYERQGTKKEITLYYNYFFDEDLIKDLGLQKRFNDFDFFVMSTLDNLKNEGNEIVSLTKIWHEMGNTGSPGPDHLTELRNSIYKGMSTTLRIDNKDVLNAWGKDTSKYKELVSPAMPVQILTENFTANGKTSSGQVRINGFSPFYIVASSIGHYTAWDKDILRLYGHKRTPRYYTVMHYLLMQIGWMRNDKSARNNKLSLQSLYKYAGAKTTRAKNLTKETLLRLLDEVFIPTGYVKTYSEDWQAGCICLTVGRDRALANKKKNLPDNEKS